MCGRITQYRSWQEMRDHYTLVGAPQNLEPRYNIAPTSTIGTIRAGESGLEHVAMRWWLVPSWWKKSLKEVPSTFNAKSEGIAAKPMFRSAFAHRRCIVWADGFYEWKRQGKDKTPYYITRSDGAPLSLAGIWESWRDPDEDRDILSCAVITCAPNAMMAQIHNRMPVVLERERCDDWLAGSAGDDLLVPCPDTALGAREVSQYVNNARHQGPRCIEAMAPAPGAPGSAPDKSIAMS